MPLEPVTDPELIALLQSKTNVPDVPDEPANQGGKAVEAAKLGATDLAGLPGDIANLAMMGDLYARNWVRRQAGLKNVPSEIYPRFPGGDDIRSGAKEMGLIGAPEDQPETNSERLAAAGIRGITGNLPFGPGMMLAGGGGGMGSEAVRQRGGGDLAQIIGGIMGGVTTGGVSNLARKSARAIGGRASENQTFADMKTEGIKPNLAGEVSNSKSIELAEHAISRSFGGAGVMRDAVDKTVVAIDRAVERAAASYSDTRTAGSAGLNIRGGIEDRFIPKMKSTYQSLLNKIPIGPDERFSVSNLLNYWDDLGAQFGSDVKTKAAFESSSLGKKIEAIQADMAASNTDQIRWGTIKAVRSEIGDMITDPAALEDVRRGQLKGLYGALSEDLNAAAALKGPEAIRSLSRSNEYYSAATKRLEDHLNPILKARTDEQAFERAASGKTSDLWALRRSMPGEQWLSVPALVLRRMGRTAEGADNFDPIRFFQNWQRIPEASKEALFRGTPYMETSRSLDRLTGIMQRISESGRYSNTSSTAGNLYFLQVLGSAAGAAVRGDIADAAVGYAASTLAPNLTAQLLTHPRFVAWLATPIGAGKIPAHLGALAQVVRSDPQLATAAKEFVHAAESNMPVE